MAMTAKLWRGVRECKNCDNLPRNYGWKSRVFDSPYGSPFWFSLVVRSYRGRFDREKPQCRSRRDSPRLQIFGRKAPRLKITMLLSRLPATIRVPNKPHKKPTQYIIQLMVFPLLCLGSGRRPINLVTVFRWCSSEQNKQRAATLLV